MEMKNLYTESDDSGKLMFRESIKNILSTGKVKVTFKKVDGTDRVMLCTTMPELLPKQETTPEGEEPKKERKPNPEVQVAFDLEKNEWRSFRYDRIISVEL